MKKIDVNPKSGNMKNKYTEIKHQLEYFYLIPVDQIVNAITKDILDFKSTDPESILNTIFKHVFKGASYYYDFIVSNMNHTFFNENYGEYLRIGLCNLIYLSLQNNCILNAFFEELALNSEPIALSGKNEPLIRNQIINCSENRKNLIGDVNSQFFNNRKGIFKKDVAKNTYTSVIIKSLNTSQNPSKNFSIEVLRYIASVANFLFMKDTCCKFGRCIDQNTLILDKYNALYKEYQDQQNNYTSPIDKLIFQSEMETFFGFTFFSSICPFLEDIHTKKTSEFLRLKNLEGQSFINIILQIANLPIFFGKDLFFRYICHSFLVSPNIDFTYFEESGKDVATRLSPSLPQVQQVINGLSLMNRFFQILSSTSLPVLFSLWKIVIHELAKENLLPKSMIDIYQEYLSNNLDVLIYRSECLSDEKICKLYSDCLREDLHINNILLRPYIHVPGTSDNCISSYSISSYLYETIQQLISNYCNIDSLKELRFPLLFLSGDELVKYNPLSRIITSLQYDHDHFDKKDYYRTQSFLIDHRKSLFEYLFSKE